MCFETLVERVEANVTEKRRTEKGNIRHKLIPKSVKLILKISYSPYEYGIY